MKIAFFGSTDFSLKILEALYEFHKENTLEIVYVITQPAKPFGRKKELKNNPIAEFCQNNSIKLFTPDKIKQLKESPEFIDVNSNLDLGIVAAYGKILPKWLLDSSRNGFINFHGSILPKYRGAVPVQMTVMNQDWDNGGVTIQKMQETMDTGPVIAKLKLLNAESLIDKTSGELMTELASLTANYVKSNIEYLLNPSDWKLEAQDDSEATYCYVDDMQKEKLEIKFNDGVKLTHGKIMSANPEPLAWVELNIRSEKMRINLLRSKIKDIAFPKTGDLNLIFDSENKRLLLELNDGFLEIIEIQPVGKKPMDGRSFANGYLR